MGMAHTVYVYHGTLIHIVNAGIQFIVCPVHRFIELFTSRICPFNLTACPVQRLTQFVLQGIGIFQFF